MFEDEDPQRIKGVLKIASNVAIGLVGVVVAWNCFYTVAQGERGVHTRMGALVGVVDPGMHFKFPIIDGAKRIDVRTQTTKWEKDGKDDTRMETYSKDQQPANIAVTVVYSLPGDERSITDIYTRYGSRDALWNATILPSTTEAMKNVFGRYDAVNAIQHRAELNTEVAAAVRELVKGKPVIINTVQLQDISFSEAYENAVEARMTAQVEVQKKEQQKQTAQIEADMKVITAKADAEQTKLNGDAEAFAIRARADALRSNPELVNLTAAEKWDGHLPETMVPGGATPFVNVGKSH